MAVRETPECRHIPGRTPHPLRDEEGHSFGRPGPEIPPEAIDLPDSWRRCGEYLYGVDLFNDGYFWEAHEAWEGVWKMIRHESAPGHFLQGLIQVAGALLKIRMGNERGVTKLRDHSSTHFAIVEKRMAEDGGRSDYMGLELASWRRRADLYFTADDDTFPYLRLKTV